MFKDLANYDLLDLIRMSAAPEEEQALVVLNFSRALGGFLERKLANAFSEEDNRAFAELLEHTNLRTEDVIAFFYKHAPNLKAKLAGFMLEFKREFVCAVYEHKLEAWKRNGAAGEGERDAQVTLWERIVALADQDEWDALVHQLDLAS